MSDVQKQMQHDDGLISVLQGDVVRLRGERDEWKRKYFEMERAQSRSIDTNGELIKRIQRLERDKDELRSEMTMLRSKLARAASTPEAAGLNETQKWEAVMLGDIHISESPEAAGRGDGWIDCKQELPPKGYRHNWLVWCKCDNKDGGYRDLASFDDYICEMDDPDIESQNYIPDNDDGNWKGSGWHREEESHGGPYDMVFVDLNAKVTHWRPLPAPPSGGPMAATVTLAGKTRAEWIAHLDELSRIAQPGEDVPMEAVIYGWRGEVSAEDLEWAKAAVSEAGQDEAALGTCADFPTTPHPRGTCEACDMWEPLAHPPRAATARVFWMARAARQAASPDVTQAPNSYAEALEQAFKPASTPSPQTAVGEGESPEVPCMDCGRPYPHGLDMVLTKKQWLMIHPDDGGVLCPSCIVNRAAGLEDALSVQAVIILNHDPDSDYIHNLRLENADYARENAELKHELREAIAQRDEANRRVQLHNDSAVEAWQLTRKWQTRCQELEARLRSQDGNQEHGKQKP